MAAFNGLAAYLYKHSTRLNIPLLTYHIRLMQQIYGLYSYFPNYLLIIFDSSPYSWFHSTTSNLQKTSSPAFTADH